MIVEPIASDKASDNFANPVSRLSTSLDDDLRSTSLAQERGEALGAQAGEQS